MTFPVDKHMRHAVEQVAEAWGGIDGVAVRVVARAILRHVYWRRGERGENPFKCDV